MSATLEQSDAFWVGNLSMTIALALDRSRSETDIRRLLKSTLEEFFRTHPAGPEMRKMLR